MKGLRKTALFFEKTWGDDLGRGKSKTAKHRFRHVIKVRMRRFLETLTKNQTK